jgi:hypothetical protein
LHTLGHEPIEELRMTLSATQLVEDAADRRDPEEHPLQGIATRAAEIFNEVVGTNSAPVKAWAVKAICYFLGVRDVDQPKVGNTTYEGYHDYARMAVEDAFKEAGVDVPDDVMHRMYPDLNQGAPSTAEPELVAAR